MLCICIYPLFLEHFQVKTCRFQDHRRMTIWYLRLINLLIWWYHGLLSMTRITYDVIKYQCPVWWLLMWNVVADWFLRSRFCKNRNRKESGHNRSHGSRSILQRPQNDSFRHAHWQHVARSLTTCCTLNVVYIMTERVQGEWFDGTCRQPQ